ncbi:YheO-like PAS domain protein [Salmonella enterica subsp. enterica serovar Daytona]|uniref:YheO-like PAS domain protein n=1 Tax=Salmonella enterica subsp. enterica serovar Daytona TaxID=1962639 RepID=A0A447JB71_SALET|nr:YheO-like PAS domain protein [Salmonella enterica subsp. enterica serovar Daytona]
MSRSLLTNETSELDLLDQRPFEQTDFDILKSYEAVVDGLAMLIGSHCEIVLHSLQDLKCSAIRIANGEHTGRKIGSPIYRPGVAHVARHDRGRTVACRNAISRARKAVS